MLFLQLHNLIGFWHFYQFFFFFFFFFSSKNETIKLDDDSLSFKAVGHGVRGENLYNFDIEFYLPIDSKVSFIFFIYSFFH